MTWYLQYYDCPPYLRKYFFPIYRYLPYAELLNSLDSPHHLIVDVKSRFREGVVLNKPVKSGKGSYVYIGLKKTALIGQEIKPGTRVTVQLDPDNSNEKHMRGKAVSRMTPLELENCYWGFSVRFAHDLNSVFSKCPFEGGYDVRIGISNKGENYEKVAFPTYRHLLIMFGGMNGLEECLENDDTIVASEPKELFNYYINTCQSHGSRAISTEENIFITLEALKHKLFASER
ncbi:putative methyltransferase C9orf114 homolog, partial [Nephila pilipes]